MGRISANFIYTFILARSSLGLLHVISCKFVPELWPLIYVEISFRLDILGTDWKIFTKFILCIHIDKISVGIVTHPFSHICTRAMVLDLLQNWFPLNILWTNGQILTKLYITIYTDKIYVGIVSCHFSHISKGVLVLD